MALQYLTMNSCAGKLRNKQFIFPITEAPNYLKVMTNFRADSYWSSYSGSFIVKSPRLNDFGTTMPATGRSRGLFQFIKNTDVSTSNFLLCYQVTTDYTVSKLYALDIATDTWYTLGTYTTPYPVDMEQYLQKIYITNVDGDILKWNGDTTNWATTAPVLRDKGGSASNIAGATLTWNGTATVTSDIDISAVISKGDWIRRSSTSAYYDEVLTVAAGGLSLTLSAASSDVGASAAGGAQKAPLFSASIGAQPYFIKFWKERCFIAGNGYRVYWSTTADPENWSGYGAGYLDINTEEEGPISGINVFGDYIFFFKDFKYYVYRWTGDLTTPIEFVKSFEFGTNSHRTIQKTSNGLIYYSYGDVRITDGINDYSIAGDMAEYFKNLSTSGYVASNKFFTTGATAGNYPWGKIDERINTYALSIPSYSSTSNTHIYDFNYQKWISLETYQDSGHGQSIISIDSLKYDVFATAQKTNQLKKYYYIVGDTSTAGTLESLTYYSGYPNKKIRVHWVEFDFYPMQPFAAPIDTDISFNYRKDLGNTLTLSTSLTGSVSQPGFAVAITTIRFNVNDVCRYFSWYLTETGFAADGAFSASDIGISSVTICYEILDSI